MSPEERQHEAHDEGSENRADEDKWGKHASSIGRRAGAARPFSSLESPNGMDRSGEPNLSRLEKVTTVLL